MDKPTQKCMVCAKPTEVLKGGICQSCQDRIRREAWREQGGVSQRADQELARHGVTPSKKERCA